MMSKLTLMQLVQGTDLDTGVFGVRLLKFSLIDEFQVQRVFRA